MNWRRATVGMVCVTTLALSAGVFGATAHAASGPTSISLGLPAATRTGQAATVVAVLTAGGAPVAGSPLHFGVAGHHAIKRTNVAGQAAYHVPRNLPPGVYTITVDFRGSGGLGYSSASGDIRILPLTGTTLSISVPPSARAGQSIPIQVTLLNAYGPMSRAPIHLLFNGSQKILLETNASGVATYRVHRNFPAGSYTVTAAYHGNRPRGFYPSSASASITISPLHLTLQALPALPGINLGVDGHIYKTDANGAVHVDVASAGYHTVSASIDSPDPNMKLRLVRWANGSPSASTTYHLLTDETVYVSFATAFLTPIRFVDEAGNPVDIRGLGEVLAIGPGGVDLKLWPSSSDQSLELPAPSRTALAQLPHNWHYSVTWATFHGTSVANRGDSPFVPGPGRTWVIKLRLYALHVHVRRPILGAGHNSVVVTSQAGYRQSAQLDAGGNATFNDLPRGEYLVRMVGPGYSLPVDMTMTRNQSVEAPVTSREELVLAYWLFLVVALALGLLARRRWRIQKRKPWTDLRST